jgi:hypothetical protein
MTYRTGRKVGRTIYHQVGPEPSDDDELIGLMDTPVLAALFVFAMNNLGRWTALEDSESVITAEVIEALRSGSPIPPGIWVIPGEMAPIKLEGGAA